MSRADWLAVAGIALSIVFGIPTVPFLLNGSPGLAFVAFLLAVLIAGLTLYLYWLSGLPPWTIVSHHASVEVKDKGGANATWRKTISLRCNQRGLQHYSHRLFACDGTPAAFRVDPTVKILKAGPVSGYHSATIEFPHQIGRFQQVTTWLETDCTNSFTGNPESMTLVVDQPVKSATLEAVLPDDRLPSDATVIYRYAGLDRELDPRPQINGKRITWTLSRTFRSIPYGEYELSWNW